MLVHVPLRRPALRPNVTELMAQARGRSPREIGYYRLRAPVKPITLAELPKIEADVKAVVRG
jgi:hypothetical protein